MKGYGELLLGLVLVALGVAGIWVFRVQVLDVIKGVVGVMALLIGAVFLMIGVSDVREKGEEIEELESEKEEGD